MSSFRAVCVSVVRVSRLPRVVVHVGLVLGFAMGGWIAAEAGAQVATKVYACQNNVRYEPDPALTNDHFGSSISFTGDFNGDGHKDLLVGGRNNPTQIFTVVDPDPDAPGSALSRAFLFLGTATSPSATPALTMNGNGIRDQFGIQVAFLDDMTNDGLDELLIAAPNWPDQFTRTGRVYIIFGRVDGTYQPGTSLVADVDAEIIIEGSLVGGRFGDALATTPFLDTDGATDFLVGAPGSNRLLPARRPYAGQVYEFFGSSPELIAAIDFVLAGPPTQPPFLLLADDDASAIVTALQVPPPPALPFVQDDDRFGLSLAILGNIDGQPGDEFAVGAPQVKFDGGSPRFPTGPGYVRVLNYLSTSSTYLAELKGNQFVDYGGGVKEGEAFGYSVAGGVDIGGDALTGEPDGINDIFIGAIQYDLGFLTPSPIEDVGAVHVYSGADFDRLLEGVGGEATRLRGEFGGDFFGSSVAGMADYVGPPAAGIPDLVVSAIGHDQPEDSVDCVPVPATSGGCLDDQAGGVCGAIYLIDGATPNGQAAYRILGESPKDSLGHSVAAGPFDSHGIAIVGGSPRWSSPCDPAADCDPQTGPCPTETGRIYIFFMDELIQY